MACGGSGDGFGVGSWMDKPVAPGKFGYSNYDSTKIRPAGFSDESDFSGDDDFDYGGFGFGDRKKPKKNNYSESYWKSSNPSNFESSLPPEEQLESACSECSLSKFKKILTNHQIDLNKEIFPGGWTLLTMACKHVAFEIVEYLVSAHVNVNCKAHDWYTPLLALTNSESFREENSDLARIAQHLLTNGADVNCVDTRGVSPLMLAAKHQFLSLVGVFLKNGAEVNAADNRGLTPLHYAAQIGNARVVRLLLEKGASLDIEDETGETAFQIARNGKSENSGKVLQLLEWSESTSWRPGMHPDLIDVENFSTLDCYISKDDKEFYKDQAEQVKLYLILNNMEKYVPLFKEHKIQYHQFFWMDDKQLQEIGIEDENDRTTIIMDHKGCRKENQLCPPYMREGWTASEALCMLSNINTHVDYQVEILEGFYRAIKDDPRILKSGIDTFSPTDLIEGSNRVTDRSYKVDTAAAELYTAMSEFENNSKCKADPEKSGKIYSNVKMTIFGIVAISVAMGIYIRYRA